MAAARVIDGEVVTSLEDGRILKLPAERIARLLAVMDDLVEAAARSTGETMVLEGAAAPAVLDLEDLVTTRWQDGAMIIEQVARFRAMSDIPQATVPPQFTASLRPYQQLGVNWLQHLRANSLGGLLADDMGLGKTAQTIAHIAIEEDAAVWIGQSWWSFRPAWCRTGRPNSPVRAPPASRGAARPGAAREAAGPHRRACRDHNLHRADARHRGHGRTAVAHGGAGRGPGDQKSGRKSNACGLPARNPPSAVSVGTPIENNLGELWSQFAFLMPGLLGSRKSFNRRFRAPIEKDGDPVSRAPVGDTHQAVHPAADEVGGSNRIAAEAYHPAAYYFGSRSARTVRDHPGDHA